MARRWDVVVIGAGPAGLAAARVVAAGGLSCAVIERMGPGGETMNLGTIHHAPAGAAGMSGGDFAAALLDEAMGAGAELVFAEATGVTGNGPWTVATDDEAHDARAVIVATGLAKGTLGLANEADYEGRGLSHCAACDGPLYAGKNVVVAGPDGWAIQEAVDLASVAAGVTLVVDGPVPAGALDGLDNLTALAGRIVGLAGDDGVERVAIVDAGGARTLEATGVFVYTDRRPATAVAPGSAARDGDGALVIDGVGSTSEIGLFAAGDARAGAAERIVEALADGENAGRAAVAYLHAMA